MKRIIIVLCLFMLCGCSKEMKDLSNMSLEEVKSYAESNNIDLNITYEYSEIEKNKVEIAELSARLDEADEIEGKKILEKIMALRKG